MRWTVRVRAANVRYYVGSAQSQRSNLKVLCRGGHRGRSEALDHVLLFGAAGAWKQDDAGAEFLGAGNGRSASGRTSGPVIAKAGDLACDPGPTSKPNDVLFIDEIHRLAGDCGKWKFSIRLWKIMPSIL